MADRNNKPEHFWDKVTEPDDIYDIRIHAMWRRGVGVGGEWWPWTNTLYKHQSKMSSSKIIDL
jgi:hypothetical protein